MPTRKAPRRRARATSAAVRAAAARAVDRVLSSEETFALLIQRLEAAGWHVERPAALDREASPLTPSPRAR